MWAYSIIHSASASSTLEPSSTASTISSILSVAMTRVMKFRRLISPRSNMPAVNNGITFCGRSPASLQPSAGDGSTVRTDAGRAATAASYTVSDIPSAPASASSANLCAAAVFVSSTSRPVHATTKSTGSSFSTLKVSSVAKSTGVTLTGRPSCCRMWR